VEPTGDASYVWNAEPTATRALQPATTVHIAACFYSALILPRSPPSFALFPYTTLFRSVALYMLDWDSFNRVSRVDVLDAATQQVLCTPTVRTYLTCLYLIWNIAGNITLRVTSNDSTNAVVSGIFFDSPSTPTYAVSGTV